MIRRNAILFLRFFFWESIPNILEFAPRLSLVLIETKVSWKIFQSQPDFRKQSRLCRRTVRELAPKERLYAVVHVNACSVSIWCDLDFLCHHWYVSVFESTLCIVEMGSMPHSGSLCSNLFFGSRGYSSPRVVGRSCKY